MKLNSLPWFWWISRIGIFVLFLATLNLVWLVPVIQNARRSASALALEISDRVEANIHLYINNAISELSLSAEEAVIEPERRELILRRMLRKNTGIRSVSFVGMDGLEQIRIDRLTMITQTDLGDVSANSAFMGAMKGTESVGDVFVSSDFEPRIWIAAPAHGISNGSGVLLAELNLRNLTDVLRELKVPQGLTYVVDREGFLVLHSDLSQLLRRPNLLDRSIVRNIVLDHRTATGLSKDDIYINERGERVFAAGKPVRIAGLGVIVEQPRGQALSIEYQMKIIAVVMVVLGTLMFVFLLRANAGLRALNSRLKELLAENDASAKLLVRKDRELSQTNERLVQLDVAKSEFVSIAAHQLRTPLTGVKWGLQELFDTARESFNARQNLVLTNAMTAAHRLIDFIGELLDLARIEEGRAIYAPERSDLISIVQNIFERYTKMAADKGLKTDFVVEGGDFPLVDLDEQKISVAFENFIDNAVKYSIPGGTITVTCRRKSDNYMEILISDTGIGIPKDQHHRVFSKFFRARNAKNLHVQGTGMGLALSKNIIDMHGGKLGFTSKEGHGTTIFVLLPIPV
jgi:signal transduction histidine kinase